MLPHLFPFQAIRLVQSRPQTTADDPSPCNASQSHSLLLHVTAHPPLRQLLGISKSSALQTLGLQSYLPIPRHRTCSKHRDFVVARCPAPIYFAGSLPLSKSTGTPSDHLNCTPPHTSSLLSFTSTSLLSYEAHDCAISDLQRSHSLFLLSSCELNLSVPTSL